MSYQGTLNIVEKLSEDHDVEVQFWADEIVNNILTSPAIPQQTSQHPPQSHQPVCMLSHDSSDDEDAGDQDSSESEGPIYSPLSDISGRIWSDESPAGMSYGDAEEDFTIEDFLSENEDESHLQGDSEVPVTPQRGNPATLQDPATPQRGDHAAPQRGDATTPHVLPPVDHATSQPGETSTAIQTTC